MESMEPEFKQPAHFKVFQSSDRILKHNRMKSIDIDHRRHAMDENVAELFNSAL